MFLFPHGQQVWSMRKKTPDAVDIVVGDGLEDYAAELIFEDVNLRARFDLVLAAQFRRDYELALGGKSSTCVFHVLHYSIGKMRGGARRQYALRRKGVPFWP